MGRHTGPKGRVNRRLGALIYEDSGAVRALERRDSPPGMSQRRRKPSNYGLALCEKQKIKYYYGLRERQLRKYFEAARRMKGNTGEQLMILCERRLDNVIRRAGFAHTRPQARQGAAHAHFRVNQRTVTIPSIRLSAGDVISVRDRPNLQSMYRDILDQSDATPAEWISLGGDQLEITVSSLPSFADVSLPVDVGRVVAFLNR